MSTIRMMTPSGKIAEVPADKVSEAQADGLVEIVRMATPTGKVADVRIDKLPEAEADGLKRISASDFETNFKPGAEKRARIEAAPTSVGSALFSSISKGSLQPLKDLRERNAAEGDEVLSKAEQMQKATPGMSFMDAYKQSGGKVSTGMPPLALTGAAGAAAAARAPAIARSVGELIGSGIKAGGRNLYSAAKTGAKWIVGGGAALATNALVEKTFGVNPIRSAIGDLTGDGGGSRGSNE